MKKIIIILFVLVTISQIACNQEDNYDNKPKLSNGWKELNCGLFLHKNGDIGFASKPQIAFTPREELQHEECPNTFITTFGFEDTTRLRDVIDTNSFESLGANFYKDKNHLYSRHPMCDGGYIRIFSDDTTSFKNLGDVYVMYKSKIYSFKGNELAADFETFKIFEEKENIAKDKNGYFLYEERVTEEELKKDYLKAEQFKRLKNL